MATLGLGFDLLHVVLAILRCQRRRHGARLHIDAVQPGGLSLPEAVPIGQRLPGVLRTAIGLLEPRVIVLA